ncbi:MAG: hypothetical protein AAGL98_05545 [Planctomycetota bacterium]
MSMQLTRLEFNTPGKNRVEVCREVGSSAFLVDVYDDNGKLAWHAKFDTADSEGLWFLAGMIQPVIDGRRGTNDMVEDVFGKLQLLAE